MTETYTFVRDTGGYNGFALLPSDKRFNVKPGATTAVTVTVPNDAKQYVAYFCVSSPDCLWISDSGAAVVPKENVTQNNSFAVNSNDSNKPYVFKGGTELSLITSSADMEVSIMFYKT